MTPQYKQAHASDLIPSFPLSPLDLFILDSPIKNQSLANISMIGLCICSVFQDWKDSAGQGQWPDYATNELEALTNAYNRMQVKVPNGIQHTVDVSRVNRLAADYVTRIKADPRLCGEFLGGRITLLYMSIDFANTLACGGTLQAILEWYG